MPKKKQLNQKVLIELIDRSCGTQQRLILPATVAHYAELMADGVEFPPVELVWNGKDTYFMWDGFQRVAAAERLGKTHVRANVETGGLRRAQWLSFHANSEHGQPRGSTVIDNILDRVLADAEWSQKSLREIARWIGCSHEKVRQKKAELGEEVSTVDSEPAKTGQKRTKPKPRGNGAEAKPKSPPRDGAGYAVPGNLINRWLSRANILNNIRILDQMKNEIENAIAEGNLGWALLNANGFYADYRNIRNRLKAAIPYAICTYCEGKGCEACHNMGFLNEETWKVAPKDE